ncbi:hypothetical protein Hdeb2414_s0017g00509041 [Helianthus debilis subsp. tardiflorus]
MFQQFFRLTKNGDWFTFETSQIDVCMISSLVTTLGSWKDRFFWVSESIVPFNLVWRHPDAVLNELEPSESKLDGWLLKALRECPSRLRSFPEHLLVLTGVSVLWDKSDQDPVLLRDDQDADAIQGEDAVARTTECRLDASGKYVNVPNVKGFIKAGSSKPSTRRSSRFPGEEQGGFNGCQPGDVYVPDWSVKVGDSFRSSAVCEDVLTHFAPPTVRGSLAATDDDSVISRMMTSACNFASMLLEGMSCFHKRMLEYEEFSKKRDKMKASIATLKQEAEGFSEKEKTLLSKVVDHTTKHEVDMKELKKRLEADMLQVKVDKEALDVQRKAFLEEKEGLKASLAQETNDNQWVIEHGFQQVVTYLLHSTKFNSALGDVYTKLLNHGKHLGFVAGYKAHESGQPLEQSSFFQPQAFDVFKESILMMEWLTYPYVGEVSNRFGKHLSVLQDLKPSGLNEVVCIEVFKSLYKKCSHSGDSEETFSDGAEGSREASLEASKIAGDGGKKLRR